MVLLRHSTAARQPACIWPDTRRPRTGSTGTASTVTAGSLRYQLAEMAAAATLALLQVKVTMIMTPAYTHWPSRSESLVTSQSRRLQYSASASAALLM